MPYYAIGCSICADITLCSMSSPTIICHSCVTTGYADCDICSEWVNIDNMCDGQCVDCRENQEDEGDECSSCGADLNGNGDSIKGECFKCALGIKKSYYNRPECNFVRLGDDSKPHFGLELELYWRKSLPITKKVDLLELMAKLDPEDQETWVAKFDGSLDADGFELESLPYTKEALQESLSIISGHVKDFQGFHGDENGLHVNCDRPSDNMHSYRIVRWMNDPEHKDFIEHIGQRELNRYCNQVHRLHAILDKFSYGDNDIKIPCEKYSPVRVEDTRLEFRIFKANMLPHRINKAIDFCQALIEFLEAACSSQDADTEDTTTVENFINYVQVNADKYPDLWNYLTFESPQFLYNSSRQQLIPVTQYVGANAALLFYNYAAEA